MSGATTFADDRLAFNQTEAAKASGLSAKTLSRLADAGEKVGRFRVGNRVLFDRETLADWLRARSKRK